jgi:hypothetical protein
MTSLRSVCELLQLRDGLLTCPHTFWQGEVEREAVEGDEERGVYLRAHPHTHTHIKTQDLHTCIIYLKCICIY